LVVDSEQRPRRGRFLTGSPGNSRFIAQETVEKRAVVVASPPAIPKSDKLLRLIACLPVAWLPVAGLAASDWKVATGLSLTERYTDNLSLVANGDAAFVTEITPSISLSRQGARGKASLKYALSEVLYDHDLGRSRLDNNLDASLNVEPVRGVLKLDGNARVAQQYASQFGATSGGTYNNTSNRVETRSVSLTPSLHNTFLDNSVLLDASLGVNYASTNSSVLKDSTSDTEHFSLGSGQKPQRLSWGAKYDRNSGVSSGIAASGTESQSYNIGYALTGKVRVFAATGRNSSQNTTLLQGLGNHYTTTGINWRPTTYYDMTATVGSNNGSASYSLSGNWIPSRKLALGASLGRRGNADSYNLYGRWIPSMLTSLSASAQKNFDSAEFGGGTASTTNNGLSTYGYSSYALNFSHRIRRAAVGLNYSETVTTAAQQYNLIGYAAYYLCPDSNGTASLQPAIPGQAIPDGCTLVGVPSPVAVTQNQTTLNKTWTGSLGYTLYKSALAFTFTQSRRQYLGTTAGGSDQTTSASASWSLPLSGRSSTTFLANSTTASAATQSSDTWSLAWNLAHRISPHMTSNFTARHSAQHTNVATTGDITENSVSAQIGMTF
jgi:hypothetical protein